MQYSCLFFPYADRDFDRGQENHTDEAHMIGNSNEVLGDRVMSDNKTSGKVTVISIIAIFI